MRIEVRNRHGYRLASGHPVSVSSYNPESEEGEDYDWEEELDRTLQAAVRAEARREARRLPTRLRRARLALKGSVDVPVPDPRHDLRPARHFKLEKYLRRERGLGRRQAREVARLMQTGTREDEAVAEVTGD